MMSAWRAGLDTGWIALAGSFRTILSRLELCAHEPTGRVLHTAKAGMAWAILDHNVSLHAAAIHRGIVA